MLGPWYHTTQARFLIAFCFGAVLFAAWFAPFLVENGQIFTGSVVYVLFAPVCHQLPDRSFAVCGHGWALCHRCCGVYLGIFLASLLAKGDCFASRPSWQRRAWALGATGVVAADAMLPYLSRWSNTLVTRFGSGLVFGCMLGSLLIPALAELLALYQARHRSSSLPDTQGDLS